MAIAVDKSIPATSVVAVLEHLKQLGQIPERIQVDNGSEFIALELDRWAYSNQVTIDFARPGKPTDNAFIESFNGSFRDECLNTHWFLSLEDAKLKINQWMRDYTEYCPHSPLNDLTPIEFSEREKIGLIAVKNGPINWEEITCKIH